MAGSFVSLAIRQAVHTKKAQKVQNIQIKLKDVQLDQANVNLDKLKVELRQSQGNTQKIDELNKQIEDQQKVIDQAQRDLQAKAKAKADEASKVAQAQATALGTTKAYAESPNEYKAKIYNKESGNCPTKWQGEYVCSEYHGTPTDPNVGYGLCQATPAWKMASAGTDWATSYETQDRWCSQYAADRYGGWENAWATWQIQRWW